MHYVTSKPRKMSNLGWLLLPREAVCGLPTDCVFESVIEAPQFPPCDKIPRMVKMLLISIKRPDAKGFANPELD